ncbi:sensor histidine kinase [Pyxidicoccus trucidator]|uniref:sensor histidine kinase n=1 Tax=Pyxidicoccus trucidator TaxID=2709662 RepID=UPI0013D9EA3E|nr:ATP-binding protein [Pyxidicoccus trucidator]
MSPPRPPPRADGEEANTPLLRKYQQLLQKHDALVRRLAEHNVEHISTFKLSSWALETSASGLTLLRGGRVVLANSRWHELARWPGPWRWRGGADGEAPRSVRTLREVAIQETAAMLSAGGPRVIRYGQEAGGRVVEVSTERLAAPGEVLVLVLARDITEQARAEEELEQARAVLAQREHLRALGEMAAGIAHDLNNTLNAMRLRLELLGRHPAVAAAPPAHMDALVRIVTDASTRISRLQSFARQQPEGSTELVRLDTLVHDALDIARGDIDHRATREGVRVHVEVDLAPLPPVRGSATDLRFVFINLLLNARDAMPRGGTIRVRGRHEGGHVIITVEDEGTGIPPEHLGDIFRPFFSTKGDKGTGLGLSMAYGVVSRAGGTLIAANRRQGGALFTLSFPTVEPAAPVTPGAARKPRQRAAAPRRGGRARAKKKRS